MWFLCDSSWFQCDSSWNFTTTMSLQPFYEGSWTAISFKEMDSIWNGIHFNAIFETKVVCSIRWVHFTTFIHGQPLIILTLSLDPTHLELVNNIYSTGKRYPNDIVIIGWQANIKLNETFQSQAWFMSIVRSILHVTHW